MALQVPTRQAPHPGAHNWNQAAIRLVSKCHHQVFKEV